MTVGSIINLGNVEAIECLPFFHKYFYMILLATIANESYDYCLREYDGQWRSLFRIGDISHDLPDPLHDEMDSLLRLLKDDLPYAVNTRDMGVLEMGGLSRVRVFSLAEQLAVAFFYYDRDEHGEWIAVRLVYGDACPVAAVDLLVRCDAEKMFGGE
jgi:hypothetical protein